MKQASPPPWQDDPICSMLSTLPEKFIVDFANGIDVVRDHNWHQRQRENSMYMRLFDGISGQGQKRQNAINASLADGLDGALAWLTELTGAVSRSNRTIELVQARVAKLQGNLTAVAHYSVDTREQLARLEQDLSRKIDSLAHDVARLDLLQRAELQRDLVLSKWKAGRFSKLPIASRCYAALEELRWGDFGHFYRHTVPARRSEHLELLENLVVAQLAYDANTNSSQRHDTRLWLTVAHADKHADIQPALAYLGDWAQPEQSPFVYSAVNLPQTLPSNMPRLCSPVRLSHAMLEEVLVREVQ